MSSQGVATKRPTFEEIKDRVDIFDYIGRHVELKPSGGNKFKGLCPFHSEKTPSFSVDQDKQFFHCFGCGAGGDVIKFAELLFNLGAGEAAGILSDEYGLNGSGLEIFHSPARREKIVLPTKSRTVLDEEVIERIRLALHLAWDHYYGNVRAVMPYLTDRTITDETARRFGLGATTPDSISTIIKEKLLESRTLISDEELIAAGLIARGDSGLYSVFRNRLMFVIQDDSGQPISFAGRALSDDQQPKYLNSSEGPLFHKGEILYGLYQAKQAIHELGFAVVVEGYMDVISLHQAGARNAVASCGTALTKEHIAILKKYTNRVTLMFDNDLAGGRATIRGIEMMKDSGLDVSLFNYKALPIQAKDIDEIIKEKGGITIQEIITASQPLSHNDIKDMLRQAKILSAKETKR